MTDVSHTADSAESLQRAVQQHVMPPAHWTSRFATIGAVLVGMEQELKEHFVLRPSSGDPQRCGPLQKPSTCQRTCSKGQEMPADVEQGLANLPKVILPKHWVRCIKHPATTGGPLCIVNCVRDANVLGQAAQDDRQHHSVAPGAGITHIDMIPARLHLQAGMVLLDPWRWQEGLVK